MIKTLFITVFMSIYAFAEAQMDNIILAQILNEKATSVSGELGRWELTYKKQNLFVITDPSNDRMRIITPIAPVEQLSKTTLLNCLTANFHSALDVKYAISNNILWSTYIHPLSPTTENQVIDAIDQVALAAITFGTTFSSTPLLFGGGTNERPRSHSQKKRALNLEKG